MARGVICAPVFWYLWNYICNGFSHVTWNKILLLLLPSTLSTSSTSSTSSSSSISASSPTSSTFWSHYIKLSHCRLFLAPNPRECYICYHDSAPQVHKQWSMSNTMMTLMTTTTNMMMTMMTTTMMMMATNLMMMDGLANLEICSSFIFLCIFFIIFILIIKLILIYLYYICFHFIYYIYLSTLVQVMIELAFRLAFGVHLWFVFYWVATE